MPFLRFFLLVFALATLASANPDDLKRGMDAIYSGRYAEAEPLLSRAYDELQRANPPRQTDLDVAAIGLSNAYQFQGRLADAERVIQPLVKRWREMKTPYLLGAADSLVSVYALQDRWAEARQLARESIEFARQHLGPDHPATRSSMSHLANLEVQQNNLGYAGDLLREVLASGRRSHAGDAELLSLLTNYGKLKIMQCEFEAAVNLLREAVQLATNLQGEGLASAEAFYSLAAAYYHAGHAERSEPLVKAAIARYEATAGPDTPLLAGASMLQADIAILNHRLGAAEKMLKHTADILKKSFGPEDVEVAVLESRMGELCLMTNRRDEAAPLIRHSLAVMERAYHGPHPRLATAYSDMAALLATEGSNDDAERYFKRAVAGFEQMGYKGVPYIRTLQSYANLLRRSDKAHSRDLMNRAKALTNSLVQQSPPLGY